MTKWTIAVLGVLAIAGALLQPWYTAHGVDGSADMAGWGAWTVTGSLDTGLRPLPLGILVCLPAGAMIVGAIRAAYGLTVVGAMAILVATLVAFLLTPAVDRRLPGRESVGIEVGAAPILVLAIAVVASAVCWIGYARCVLRSSPRAEIAGA